MVRSKIVTALCYYADGGGRRIKHVNSFVFFHRMISKINQYERPIIGNFIYQFFPTLFKELKVERYFSFFFFSVFFIIEIEIV